MSRPAGAALSPAFRGVLEAAARRYLRLPGVLGVALGFKLRGGRRAGGAAVQFYVGRKSRRPARRLPRFVFGRDACGRALRGVRIPTDVVALRPPRFAWGAGSRLRAAGERGAAALLFRDKSRAGRAAGAGARPGAFYLVTCAHVAGDLERSPPSSPGLRLDAGPGADPFAVVLKNSTAAAGVVEYDAALARVTEASLPAPDLSIEGGGRVTGWLEHERLSLGDVLELSAPSGRRRGVLEALAGEIRVILDRRSYRVRNLWGLRAPVREGDSGSLVHRGGRAAGFVVARSPEGFAWWQPLRPALEHLNRLKPRTSVRPFFAG